MRTVPYVAVQRQFANERDALHAAMDRVVGHGQFVMGPEVEDLEKRLAEACGTSHAIAVNSGTDALSLTLRALGIGPGDEVVTAPNSFIATASSIVHTGATPVFADVGSDMLISPEHVARAVTPRTKAILPVHLTGRTADMTALNRIAGKNGLHVIEDAAQAFGATSKGVAAGALGLAGCFSAHPLKNLNAGGDAGFVTTSDAVLAERLKRLRNHGLEGRDTVTEWGYNSRLDTLQAAFLLLHLENQNDIARKRQANADVYRQGLSDLPLALPEAAADGVHVFHTFIIRTENRDGLRDHLARHGVETAIHYPTPLHLQPAALSLGYRLGDFPNAESQSKMILSLPIHQFLSADDLSYVVDAIRLFFNR